MAAASVGFDEAAGAAVEADTGERALEAALGAMLEVPSLDGAVKLRVPPGVQPGQELRLRGKGMPRFGGYSRGDQIVTVQVVVPTALDDAQRALVEQLASSLGQNAAAPQRSLFEKLKDLL